MELLHYVIIGAITVLVIAAAVLLQLIKNRNNKTMSTDTKQRSVFLTKERQKAPLIEKTKISPDTILFRFGLPSKTMALGLPTGKHIKVFGPNRKGVKEGEWNGKADTEKDQEIRRSYTPVSSDDDLGHFDLIIKVYKGGVIDRFPDGGKMSQHFESMEKGDLLDLQGPFGLIEYKGHGKVKYSSREFNVDNLGLIAGGTGITPMLQVIEAVLKDPDDKTSLYLLFANQTEKDILVRERLEELQAQHPKRFHLWFTLDKSPGDHWKYDVGFVSAEMIAKRLPAPEIKENKETNEKSFKTLVLMCGPPPMIQYACDPNLAKLGFDKAQCVAF